MFLGAGGVLAGYATLKGLAAFTGTAYPAVEDIVGPVGFVLGFVGLLGLYSTLVERSPTLTRAAAVFTGLGAAGFSVISVSNVAEFAGLVPDGQPPLFPLLLGMAAAGVVVGYLSFGVASLRTDVYPRPLGLFLPLPALIFGAMAVGGATGAATAIGALLISSGQALAHLSIGVTLRRGIPAGEQDVQPADVTPG